MDEWLVELRAGALDASWDLFLTRYRRLIFAAIRHYAHGYDDTMDVFAHVCEALRADELRRLRQYVDAQEHRARFTTWLVAVVRNLTIDWFRRREGRHRLPSFTKELSPLRQRIVQHVWIEGRTHSEAYELIRASDPPGPTFRQFLVELRATYQVLTDRRRGRLFRELGSPPPPEPDPERWDPGETPDRRQWMTRILSTLPEEDRVALELYVVDELPAADIARILGLPNPKAVYNRVYRALAALRETLVAAGIGRTDL